MEINFCEEGVVTIGNKTGRITLTVEEIQRLTSLVRAFGVELLDKKLKEYQEKRLNALPCVPLKCDDVMNGKIGGWINEIKGEHFGESRGEAIGESRWESLGFSVSGGSY